MWQAVGMVRADGLVALEERETEARLAADVRGGVAWPWPMAVGAKLVAAGAVVVLGFEPATGMATLLSWTAVGSVAPVRDGDGWPVDGGVTGALRMAAAGLRCARFYALCGDDEQEESMRTVRGALAGEFPGLRVTPLGAAALGDARGILWRWGSARRLRLGDAALATIEREEQEPVYPQPLTVAVAAALESWEIRPWRGKREEAWKTMPRTAVGR